MNTVNYIPQQESIDELVHIAEKCLIGEIRKLSAVTGYKYEFLLANWFDCVEEDLDWDYFLGVTMELDW